MAHPRWFRDVSDRYAYARFAVLRLVGSVLEEELSQRRTDLVG